MRRRLLKLGALFFFIGSILLCFYSLKAGIILLSLAILVFLLLLVLLILNKAIKNTNWYKNIFIYTEQMCSNEGYRNYLIRNLDVVNVGSNPARFAFHYDTILGENWSTGNQGKDMDYEILKFRHSFLKRRGVVLLPITPFSGVAGFLKNNNPSYFGVHYYAKFAKTLDPGQALRIPECGYAMKWLRFPILFEPKSLRYLFFDVKEDNRLEITDMRLTKPQRIEDARHWVEGWLNEFELINLEEPLNEKLKLGVDNSVKIMQETIDFLVERDLKPVLVLTPMCCELQNYFTEPIKEKLIYNFVKQINRSVEFLDYSNDNDLQRPELYFNTLYMNLRGRKIFTNRVLKDLNLVNK